MERRDTVRLSQTIVLAPVHDELRDRPLVDELRGAVLIDELLRVLIPWATAPFIVELEGRDQQDVHRNASRMNARRRARRWSTRGIQHRTPVKGVQSALARS